MNDTRTPEEILKEVFKKGYNAKELLEQTEFIEWVKVYAPETYMSLQETFHMANKLVAKEPPAEPHSQR
jgi:hypothetical protein